MRNSPGETYEATLGYLEYSGSSDKLSIPIRIRERHLTPEVDSALLQAIGEELQIAIFSQREDITIRIPLHTWFTSGTYEGTLTGANKGHLTIGRFEDHIDYVKDEESGEREVPATIKEIEVDVDEVVL